MNVREITDPIAEELLRHFKIKEVGVTLSSDEGVAHIACLARFDEDISMGFIHLVERWLGERGHHSKLHVVDGKHFIIQWVMSVKTLLV